MKIKLLCFGRLDTDYFNSAFLDYAKRLKRYCDLEVIELKEEFKFDPEKNKKINSELALNKMMQNKDYETVIFNVSEKEAISSEEFSKLIETNKNKVGKIQFLIGPSEGFDKDLINKLHRISFGRITFPHQLFRVIVVEQIYRAFKIINNEIYHK